MSDTNTPEEPPSGWSGSGSARDRGGMNVARMMPNRSVGLKLLLVCVLALAMAIPAGFVWALVYERERNAEQAVESVSEARGGRQVLLGPVLIAPYEQDYVEKTPAGPNGALIDVTRTRIGRFVVFAEEGRIDAGAKAETLTRGIHDVPVFEATADMNARFDLTAAMKDAPRNARILWDEARIYMGLSDLRGVRDGVSVVINGAEQPLEPQSGGDMNGAALTYHSMGLMGASAKGVSPDRTPEFVVTSRMVISGAQRLGFTAFAKTTDISLQSDWTTPSFEGGFLPVEREWGEDGFSATWRVPYLARSARGAGPDLNFDELLGADMAVKFIDDASPYQSVNRALKYAPMFLGLVFLTYFLFEATSGSAAHPAQYVLVGLAQCVFYLLLLGVAEHLGFTVGFLAAAIATIMLLSLYAGAVFKTRDAMVQAFAAFTTLYVLIYILMRMEDYALLVGSVASFIAIAATMFMTRNLNWYGLSQERVQAS